MADEQHKGDLDRVSRQNSFTDTVRGVEDRTQSGGLFSRIVHGALVATPVGQAIAARTDFDGLDLDLNAMIDLVQQTDPEDLESSGKALWDARDAIKEAADGLNGRLAKIHWVGESGEALRSWGTSLVENTQYLSDYAGSAGDQITAAAVGLAAVRGAMPARDTRSNQKRPNQFTEAEKAANKEEYAAAVAVEKDRQEAINQMNRLSSYYAVSTEVLSALPAKQPTFKPEKNVAVPKPKAARYSVGEAGRTGSGDSGTTGAVGRAGTDTQAERVGVHDTSDVPPREVTGNAKRPDVSVGTNIDSVNTLLPNTTPVTGPTPPTMGTPVPGGGQPHTFESGLGTPMPPGTQGRNLGGTAGLRNPSATGQGRPSTPNVNNQGVGRTAGQGPMNQMGRSTSTGQAAGKAPVSGSQSSQMGRGISGGTPRAGGTASPRTDTAPTTGAGRSNGVVGGRPTTGDASARGGSRIPRGTVVGGDGAANSRPATGRPGQRGVFGVPEPTARPGSGATAPRTGAGGSDPVTGRATGRHSAAGAERNGMTRGGAGLVRGAGKNEKPGDDDTQATQRPDYLVEDQETHLPNKPRRDVPPVVN
ncbi:hypothetical protein K4B79_37995 [Streptomyces lincolnensis]|uniref:hypothetical protein n=1 Tax=Streptomyces lincolnensis TaxID=1915 RepID=UPI001E61B32D|nr:hypothetical protein [Streptomyces lincolnensis]MCD7443989.1 hypothetical protein [Streptomyces lincolnensis]